MTGELVYFTVGIPDSPRAQAFYGALLGWQFEPGSAPNGSQILNAEPPGGLHGGADASSVHVYFAVDDIDAAVARVRELGGEADEPQHGAHGSYVSCRDDQGTQFNLHQAPRSQGGEG